MSNSGFEYTSTAILNKVARVVEGVDKRFHHTFGGPTRHSGTTPPGCDTPLHLLYVFDTSDPAFPLRIPKIRYLPLYYSFPYNAGACGYRVMSETKIEVLYMETKEVEKDFPYTNYPSEFPRRRVRLASIPYRHHKTLVFYLEAGEEALSEGDRKLILEKYRYPFTQLGGIHRMWQDVPSVRCPNSACENSEFTSTMDVIAVIWNQPHKGVFLWDVPHNAEYSWEKDYEDTCDVQVIFQICPKCHSIHACNRST